MNNKNLKAQGNIKVSTGAGILIILVIASLAVLAGMGLAKSQTSSTTTVIPGQTTIPQQQSGTLYCGAPQSGFPKVETYGSYVNQQTGIATGAAVPTNVVIIGPGTPSQTAAAQPTTSASAYTYINGSIACGSKIMVYYGASEGTSYYTHASGPFTVGPNQTQAFDPNLIKEAQLNNYQVSNGTNSYSTRTPGSALQAGVTIGQLAVAGANFGPIKLTITTGAGGLGGTGVGITCIYNTSQVNNCYVANANGARLPTTTYPLQSGANVLAGMTGVTYLSPPLLNWSTTYTFWVNGKLSSGFTQNTPIGLFVQNQALVYANGAATPGFNTTGGTYLGQTGVPASNTVQWADTTNHILGVWPIHLCIVAGC